MLSFKGCHFQKEIILLCTRWYLTYPLSYRYIEEMMEERGEVTENMVGFFKLLLEWDG